MVEDVESGRSPSGSGCSAEPEPCCTVSADTASIPNAIEHLINYLEMAVRTTIRVDECATNEWESLTFRGKRYRASIWADCVADDVLLIHSLAEMSDMEFDVPGVVVADAVLAGDIKDVPTWGGCSFTVEMLVVNDDPAQAIEARRAATGNTDAVADESAVSEADAPVSSSPEPHGLQHD